MKRALVLPLLLLAACSISRTPPPGGEVEMVVPASLAESDRVQVDRRANRLAGEQLKFGDWQVVGYRQGWRHSPESSIDFGPIEQIATSTYGRYQFGLKNTAGDAWQARCVDRASGEGIRIRDDNEETVFKPEERWSLACDMYRGEELWKLRYAGGVHVRIGRVDRVGGGELTNGRRTLLIEPEYELRNVPIRLRPMVPVGYVLKDEDNRPLAAVNRDDSFAWVRFANDVDAEDREAIAAAATALLLQPDVE